MPVARAYALDLMMTDAAIAHEIHIYPDAQHGFNFPEMKGWYNPADAHDAWDRTVAFLAKYLMTPSKLAPASGVIPARVSGAREESRIRDPSRGGHARG